jgi:preprotein translocase subunit SecE
MATASDATQTANRSGMDPKRLVVIFYLLGGFVTALFVEHVLSMVWDPLGFSNPELIEGLGWKVTTVLGVLLTAGLVVFCFLNPKVRALSLETASELMKVTWPTWSETKTSTVAVVVASLVAAVILYAIDLTALHLMVEWLPALWGKL